MEIPGELPKYYIYANKLREEDPPKVRLWTGIYKWLKRKLPITEDPTYNIDSSKSEKVFTKNELTVVLGNEGGDWPYKFLDQIEKDGIIEKVGTNNRGDDLFVFTHNWKKKLAQEMEKDDTWRNQVRPISKFILNKAENKELI
jgi:hypothetical protein